MRSHKQIIAEFARSGYQAGSRREAFHDFISDQGYAKCDNCGSWGDYGSEVVWLDEDDLQVCEDCVCMVWGWIGEAKVMIAASAFPGKEVETLLRQYKEHCRECGIDADENPTVYDWGYEPGTEADFWNGRKLSKPQQRLVKLLVKDQRFGNTAIDRGSQSVYVASHGEVKVATATIRKLVAMGVLEELTFGYVLSLQAKKAIEARQGRI